MRPPTRFIVEELCGMSLSSHIHKRPKPLTLREVVKVRQGTGRGPAHTASGLGGRFNAVEQLVCLRRACRTDQCDPETDGLCATCEQRRTTRQNDTFCRPACLATPLVAVLWHAAKWRAQAPERGAVGGSELWLTDTNSCA